MNGLPTWLRVWLSGMWWGVLSGNLIAVLAIALLLLPNAGDGWLDWSGTSEFVISLFAALVFGCIYGSVIGFVMGCLTGLVAGPVLELALSRLKPRAAVRGTVVFVLLVQFGIGVALTEEAWLANLVVPAISALPMWLAMLRIVGKADQVELEQRHDTLAA